MDNTAQKCPGGEHYGFTRQAFPVGKNNPGDVAIFYNKVDDLTFNYLKIGLLLNLFQHFGLVNFTICLRPRTLYRWAFSAVQQPKLDTRLVSNASHNPIHRVDFTNQMAFPQSTDSRVARHHTDPGF